MRKFACGMMLTLLLVGLFAYTFHVKGAESGSIYIRADGSVDPPTTLISTTDNVTYTVTDDITFLTRENWVFVQRNNVVIDGQGHVLRGTGQIYMPGHGIELTSMTNVTIKNLQITLFMFGVWSRGSSGINVSGNNITHNIACGVFVDGGDDHNILSNNITGNGYNIAFGGYDSEISGNLIADSPAYGGIDIVGPNNRVSGNEVTNNSGFGLRVQLYNNTVSENNVTANPVYGIELLDGSNNTVLENRITNNGKGIHFTNSSVTNVVSKNNITNNNEEGIYLESSSNNTFWGNNITYNGLSGALLAYSSDSNTVSENDMANNSAGVYIYSSSFCTLWANNVTNNGAGFIVSCPNNSSSFGNIIAGNNVTSNVDGIILELLPNNTISENTISMNQYGLSFWSSSNNTVTGNTITANTDYGLYLEFSSGNRFFHNNFIDNTPQVLNFDPNDDSNWDDGYPSGGNYWSSSYAGGDYNGDGFGDSPYVIDANNKDNYPLMSPYEYWTNPIPGDVNRDMTVNMRDVGLICNNFGRIPISLVEKHCDINADNIINMRDIGIACANFGKYL